MNLGEEQDIRELQLKLRALGYYEGELTGIFDKETEQAVRAFQNKHLPRSSIHNLLLSIYSFLVSLLSGGKTQHSGIVDQTTAEAINKEYELLQARRRFGIPDMESAAISRLQRVGVSQLSDILRSDADQLLNRTNLDRELLARLRNTAVISNSTGLNPRNAYALVQVGGVNSVDQLKALSEEELHNIFKTAQDRGMLSDPDQAQIDFFLGTVAARSKKIFSDVRSVFPTIEEDEAVRLASIDIFRGRDLRSIDVEVVAGEIGLDQERLEVLKQAAELVQIRGITSNMAIALAGKGRVGGIRGFADIDGVTLLEILESLKQDGELEPEEADISEPQAEEMIVAAKIADCQSDLCSQRGYLDYLIGQLEPSMNNSNYLTERFKQDFARTEANNTQVLFITIVVSVLEKVVVDALDEYLLAQDIARVPKEGYSEKEWIEMAISTIPSGDRFFSMADTNFRWPPDLSQLPRDMAQITYLWSLIDLHILTTLRQPTREERVRRAQALSDEYKIDILGNHFQVTTWLNQAIITLQKHLCEVGIHHRSRSEWCTEAIERIYFPENFFDFKIPLLRYSRPRSQPNLGPSYIGEFEGLSTLWSLLNSYFSGQDEMVSKDWLKQLKSPLTDRLSSIRQVMDAEDEVLKGHMQLQTFNPMGAISFYTTAAKYFAAAIPMELDPWVSMYISFIQKFEKDPFEELLATPVGLVGKMADFWDISADVELTDHLEDYERYQNYNPSGFSAVRDLETGDVYDVLNSLEELQFLLPSSFGTFHEEYLWYKTGDISTDLPEVKRRDLSEFINYAFNDVMASIMHYTNFTIPLSIGDALSEMGHYSQARVYYNSIYNFDLKAGYTYLNQYVELPHLKMRIGSNYIEWAESLYRENTSKSIVRAKCLYEKVLDLFDDYIPNNENQFAEMSLTIEALLELSYDDLPVPSALRRILDAVSNIQHLSIKVDEIPRKYRLIQEITKGEDKNQIASKLSDELDLDIRFSSSREVFMVIDPEISSSNGDGAINGSSLADSTQAFIEELGISPQSAPTLADTAPGSAPCKIPCNPVIEAQIQKAQMRLSQIKRGLNILGYSDEMVPVLRYTYLVNQAKMFTQLAVAAEKDFLQFLSNAEEESFNQLTAQQAFAIAAANVRVEQARAGIAQQRIELAHRQKAQLEQEIANLELEIKEANDPIYEEADWARASDQYASLISFLGIQAGSIVNQFTGGALGGMQWGPPKVIGKLFGNSELEGDSPIAKQYEASLKAREHQINRLTRQKNLLEYHGRRIAQQQINIAIAEHELAQRQVAVAQLQVEHAQQILFFLQTKFLNKELWYELAKETRAIYRKLLDYATTTAFLAEQALEYKMNQRLNVIRFDYYRPGRHGLLGAENLQADIATLEYQKILLSDKKIPVKAAISLGEEFPQELLRFTSIGRAHFATDFSQFDLLYPGAYQSRISRVEVVIEGLVPPEGIHGTLSTSGVSYVRTRANQVQPLAGNPETMILSSYTIRGDQVVFYKTGEELELFEGLGVVIDWTLELPKAANNMNYQTITDVKLVIYYTALFDDSLRNLVIRRWPKGSDAYRGLSMRFQYPDGFYHFNNNITKSNILFCIDRLTYISDLEAGTLSQAMRDVFEYHGILLSSNANVATATEPEINARQINDPDNNKSYPITAEGETLFIHDEDGDQYEAVLTFETSDAYFPTNQEHRQIVNLNIVMVSADEQLPAPIPFTLGNQPTEPIDGDTSNASCTDFTRQDGFRHVRASSNVGMLESDGTPQPANPLNVFEGLGMNQEWKLQLTFNSRNHPELFTQNDAGEMVPDLSKIVDILFFIEYRYDRTDLTIAEHFDDGAANWLPVNIAVGNTTEEYSPWQVESGAYRGSDPRLQCRLDVDKALSHLPSGTQDRHEQLMSDNVMISFRTKVCREDNNRNFALFYFADGYYALLLTHGQEVPSVSLWKLSEPYNHLYATESLGESSNQDFLIIPNRWYTVEIGMFRGRIDIVIDGAEVINVFDSNPNEGAGIGLGTGGTGDVYFDDILI